MRFELIDQVVERSADRLVALKAVTTAEEYLGDHFPGFAVLPGVMMLETLVQAARLLVRDITGDDSPPMVLAEARNVRYGNMVRPGQSLKVEVTLRKKDERGYDFQGIGTVGGSTAVQGRFRLAPLTV